MQGFWENILNEILALNEKIGQLSHRIAELENVTSPHECHSSELSTDLVSSEQSYAAVVYTPPAKGIETQVAHLTETISKRQKTSAHRAHTPCACTIQVWCRCTEV